MSSIAEVVVLAHFVGPLNVIRQYTQMYSDIGSETGSVCPSTLLEKCVCISASSHYLLLSPPLLPSLSCRALIRPGRFDRRVVITLPDVRARHDILKVHLAKVKLSPDVDLQILARGTSGFSGVCGGGGRGTDVLVR